MVMAAFDQRHQQERLEYLRVHRATHVSGVAILPCRRERLRRLGRKQSVAAQSAINDAEADRIALLPSVRFVTRREEARRRSNSGIGASNRWGFPASRPSGSKSTVATSSRPDFTRLEDLSNSPVAVINRKLEDQLFRGRDPIGQTIHVAGAGL